jgi:uncharacterized membrane protein YqjE
MAEENGHKPGLAQLVSSLARAGVGMVHNRGELLALEWQEEKARQVELLFFACLLSFMGFVGLSLLTAIVIFLFPEDLRLYVAGMFALLYLSGATWAGFTIKSLLKRAPFSESLEQLNKDRAWLDSLR